MRVQGLRVQTVALALTAGLLIPGVALTADRGTIQLRGTVPATCSISVSASSATVDIARGQSLGTVASVEERCNAAGGYVVSVSSQNGGQLVGGGAGVPYSLFYGEAGAGQGGRLTAERGTSGDVRRSTLAVTVPANPQAQAGEYEDTVTISIAAK